MTKTLAVAALALAISACAKSPNDRVVDQCLRAPLFQECLKSVPAGPQFTHYNDWDEVVSECGQQAYYLSLRPASQVAVKCGAGGGGD